ncbi:hypothetical protein [Ideonella oryzae]|uniref:Uncharacterized protein n=1 Tax=Ideonella oryzae TaxID=2937441 RepID=A0ABT1BKZ1_9BURK|nr:hypothetical protein [Ideonella oryzae]MCO5976881.1 hypothetical protein [Ideonella oryzae]
MGPLDALWHLLNFFGPALGVGLAVTLLAKLIWWRELKAVSFQTLALWCVAVGAMVLVAGLVIFGRDGRMATYGALVLAMALTLGWRGGLLRR